MNYRIHCISRRYASLSKYKGLFSSSYRVIPQEIYNCNQVHATIAKVLCKPYTQLAPVSGPDYRIITRPRNDATSLAAMSVIGRRPSSNFSPQGVVWAAGVRHRGRVIHCGGWATTQSCDSNTRGCDGVLVNQHCRMVHGPSSHVAAHNTKRRRRLYIHPVTIIVSL